MDLKKKIIITAAGCAAILCAFAGVGHLLPKQEPIELETVSDEVPAEEEKAPQARYCSSRMPMTNCPLLP